MTAATDVEIDEQTRDELQPPCEVIEEPAGPCERPAEWIAWLTSILPIPNSGDKALICGPHKTHLEQHLATCGCGRVCTLHVEPLR